MQFRFVELFFAMIRCNCPIKVLQLASVSRLRTEEQRRLRYDGSWWQSEWTESDASNTVIGQVHIQKDCARLALLILEFLFFRRWNEK